MIRAWLQAPVKPAPDEPLGQELISFLGDPLEVIISPPDEMPGHFGRKVGINTLMIISHGRTVELTDDFNPREFWAELYTLWYRSLTGDELATVLDFEEAVASCNVKDIERVANQELWLEDTRLMFIRHRLDTSLLPDLEPDSGYNAFEMWTLIQHNAMKFGGVDLWKTILDAHDKDVQEIERLAERHPGVQGATAFFEQRRYGVNLLPDFEAHPGYNRYTSFQLWSLIKHNAIASLGNSALWGAIVATSDRNASEN